MASLTEVWANASSLSSKKACKHQEPFHFQRGMFWEHTRHVRDPLHCRINSRVPRTPSVLLADPQWSQEPSRRLLRLKHVDSWWIVNDFIWGGPEIQCAHRCAQWEWKSDSSQKWPFFLTCFANVIKICCAWFRIWGPRLILVALGKRYKDQSGPHIQNQAQQWLMTLAKQVRQIELCFSRR